MSSAAAATDHSPPADNHHHIYPPNSFKSHPQPLDDQYIMDPIVSGMFEFE